MTNAKVVDMIIEAIVTVIGNEAWDAMSANEQHDAIMKMVNDLYRAI